VLKARGLFIGTVDGLSDTILETGRAVNHSVAQSITTKTFYPDFFRGCLGAKCSPFSAHTAMDLGLSVMLMLNV
jgi:hypothetical protein